MKFGTFGQILLFGLISGGCLAGDTSLTISGNVTASPCVVDTDSANQTIDFGQRRSRDFPTVGGEGGWQYFSVLLTQCPISTRQATVLLTGVETSGMDGVALYANQGSASNVGIQVVDGNSKQTLGPGSRVEVPVDNVSQSATLALASRVYGTGAGPVTAGQIRAVMQLDFTYQ